MSAWIVTSGHIDVLVNAMAQYGIDPGMSPRDAGQLLWRENHRSVNARYGERTRTPSYRLTTTEAPLHPVAVLKALGCYEYQTCEHAGWPTSKAHRFCERLTEAILHNTELNAETYHGHPVYNSAPWGFDDLHDAEVIHYNDNGTRVS